MSPLKCSGVTSRARMFTEGGDDIKPGWAVDLGGVTVEARYHGLGQTEETCSCRCRTRRCCGPGTRSAEAPAIPWLPAEVTLRAVQAGLPDGTSVAPGHGQPVTPGDMTFAIDYLAAMIAGVRAAVADGLSAEQTVEAVTLEEFQGYGLGGDPRAGQRADDPRGARRLRRWRRQRFIEQHR